jgi:hypothetical protein
MRKLWILLAALAALALVSCVTIKTGTNPDGTRYTKTTMSGEGTVTIDVDADGKVEITGEAKGISDAGAGLIGGVLGDLGGAAASVFGGGSAGDTIVNVGGETTDITPDSD